MDTLHSNIKQKADEAASGLSDNAKTLYNNIMVSILIILPRYKISRKCGEILQNKVCPKKAFLWVKNSFRASEIT